MAGLALVNPNTVSKAYRELEHLGVALGRNGSGVYVTEHGVEIARQQRQAATLEAFAASARAALIAGHGGGELVEELGRLIATGAALVGGIAPGDEKGNPEVAPAGTEEQRR